MSGAYMKNNNFEEYLEEINYSLMFTNAEEEYELYYLTNEEGLGAEEVEALCAVAFEQLNTFITNNARVKGNVNPIITSVVDADGNVDVIILVRKSELGKITIVDNIDFENLSKYTKRNEFMINYYMKGISFITGDGYFELKVYKEMSDKKSRVLQYLENQFEYLGLQLARKRNKEV